MKFYGKYIVPGFMLLALYGFQLPSANESSDKPKRPFYEYPGNYGDEVLQLEKKFKSEFGYDLVEFGEAWRPDQIKRLHAAFAELPPAFFHLKPLKALYRLSRFVAGSGMPSPEEVPAATLPKFMTLYDFKERAYKVYVGKGDLRVEFYNPLFYEKMENLKNIIQHEMGHGFDMAKGLLSFSPEWISISKFHIIHLPAMDGKPDSDFLFTLLNDPGVDNYAPIALRHLPTYSRQNIQEDFANSVTAYMHYPYFRYTHPARYRFMKERVFAGKEYFPAIGEAEGFRGKVLADFREALEKKEWDRVRGIILEVSRGYYPEVDEEMVLGLREVLGGDPSPEKDLKLGLASCFLLDPGALELRRDLGRQKRVEIKKFLKNERCFRVGRSNFQKNLVKWAPQNVFFFREKGRDTLQFLDPVLGVAHARGYKTQYSWKIFLQGGETRPLARGNLTLTDGGPGSVKVDLKKSAEKDFVLPPGRPLVLELGAKRIHSRRFNIFDSAPARIHFVVQPWFKYQGPDEPRIRVIYPLGSSYQHQN
ncbi:MAG: hypothetical protein ACE5E9_01010 [Nitrospinaceae bacterium]